MFFEVAIFDGQPWVSAHMTVVFQQGQFIVAEDGLSMFESVPLAETDKAFKNIVLDALCYCEFIDNKDRFIVEVEPKQKKRAKKKMQNNVTTYVTLRISDIQKRYKLGLSEKTGIKRAPHPVRKHTRTLRSERYGKNRGKQITIPAYWCGEKETTIGNKHYRVLTEQ